MQKCITYYACLMSQWKSRNTEELYLRILMDDYFNPLTTSVGQIRREMTIRSGLGDGRFNAYFSASYNIYFSVDLCSHAVSTLPNRNAKSIILV